MKFERINGEPLLVLASQLHSHARDDFKFFSHFLGMEPELVAAARFPLARWPNGHWCMEVNLFMTECFKKGFSLRGSQGGTLGTYCSYLAPLIRYVNSNMDGFAKMTDSHFALAVRQLRVKVARGEDFSPKNKVTSTVKIASVWLDFLVFVGDYYATPSFVSKEGTIRAYRIRKSHRLPNGRTIETYAWNHWSFPTEEDLEHVRLPIDDKTLLALRTAADDVSRNTSESAYIHSRRLVMFALFDEVGLRRMESATKLTRRNVVEALEARDKARASGEHQVPMLSFDTVKHTRSPHREVPVSPILLDFLEEYLVSSRRRLRHIGVRVRLDTPLLFNAKTGEALRPNTITQEFAQLAKRAGIKVPASPHLMRHRYITNALVRLIIAHNVNTKSDFQKLILDDTDFKRKVKEVTGHASVAGLEPYLTLAFDIVGKLDMTVERARILAALDALHRAVEDHDSCVKRGVDASGAKARLAEASIAIDSMYRHSDLYPDSPTV
ncbi:hypothetical protein [Paraburkholderia caffeinilytica]|uniref:hypothetical protein n=1 Tax=Paraburkholderia caffeinilytica TaxID=1761016 RepID=UPI0038BDEB02